MRLEIQQYDNQIKPSQKQRLLDGMIGMIIYHVHYLKPAKGIDHNARNLKDFAILMLNRPYQKP